MNIQRGSTREVPSRTLTSRRSPVLSGQTRAEIPAPGRLQVFFSVADVGFRFLGAVGLEALRLQVSGSGDYELRSWFW